MYIYGEPALGVQRQRRFSLEGLGSPPKRWMDTPEQQTFLERVLAAHITRSRTRKKRPPLPDLFRGELSPVWGTGVSMKSDAAMAAGKLLAAANRELDAAKAAGERDGLKIIRISAASGYRPRAHQERLWRTYFKKKYYNRTATSRVKLPGGPHGDEAVSRMVKYVTPKIAAPGFSNHQAGLAIDFKQVRAKGKKIRNSTDPRWVSAWQSSWFFRWLNKNAARFGFYPYLREPWHWTYRPTQPSVRPAAPSPAVPDQISRRSVLSSLFQQFGDAVRRGKVALAIGFALTRGIRDENQLTNWIFFARHPERQGQKLRRKDPQFKQLSKEWLDIRNRLVRRTLALMASSSQAPAMPTASRGIDERPVELASLRSFISASTAPTEENALSITKIICGYHNIPWRIGYIILEHEGGVWNFKKKHPDGVMQTIKSARDGNIRRIPQALKLRLLDLPATDKTPDRQLTQRLHREFSHRLAIQVATGIQELKTALERFHGYVALAFAAYNTGRGNVAKMVTKGKSKTRPRNLTDAQWEGMCRAAASLLHQRPNDVRIKQGVWLCDPHQRRGKWLPRYGSKVYDRKSGVRLRGYHYLRSVKGGCVPAKGPTSRCDYNIPKNERVQPGKGELKCRITRRGSLDKLYDPRKLGKRYYKAAQIELPPIVDDNLPLKVYSGRLVKVRFDGSLIKVPS